MGGIWSRLGAAGILLMAQWLLHESCASLCLVAGVPCTPTSLRAQAPLCRGCTMTVATRRLSIQTSSAMPASRNGASVGAMASIHRGCQCG
eukprot:2989415-Alexandrium_andersonii.AAC.1